MKTILPYLTVIIITALVCTWLLTNPKFKVDKPPDPRDRIIDSLTHRNSQNLQLLDSLGGLLTSQQDSFLKRLKTYENKSFKEKVKTFTDRTGKTDTIFQPYVVVDSSQIDACNRCFLALDSNRAVVRIQSKIITLSEDVIANCSKSNGLLTDQITECREDVENWERLYNLRWWQIFKRIKLKRKLK